MPAGIGATGFLGLAIETVPGTFTPPTKYVPFMTESLAYKQNNTYRRPVRATPDQVGVIPGYFHVEGGISMEYFDETAVYFHHASRVTVVKSGTTPNWIYTFTPTNGIVTPKTLSLTVVRNGVVFGYAGCVVGNLKYTLQDGALMMEVGIQGLNESTPALPTATWPTTLVPYGPGGVAIQIPSATPVLDTDNFEFAIEDNAEAQNRINATSRGAQFIKFGERHVTATLDRDFIDKTDFTAFKAVTAQTMSLVASSGANNGLTINMNAAIKDTYEPAIGNQGDLVRASIAYEGVLDATGFPYTVVIKTQETIT